MILVMRIGRLQVASRFDSIDETSHEEEEST